MQKSTQCPTMALGRRALQEVRCTKRSTRSDEQKIISDPNKKRNSGSTTYLVERSTKGRATCLSSCDAIGGTKAAGTIDDATGLKADEAPLAMAAAPTSTTSCPRVASFSAISNASKQATEEAGRSAPTQILGSWRRSSSFLLEPTEGWHDVHLKRDARRRGIFDILPLDGNFAPHQGRVNRGCRQRALTAICSGAGVLQTLPPWKG
jgi:hypothetical protein